MVAALFGLLFCLKFGYSILVAFIASVCLLARFPSAHLVEPKGKGRESTQRVRLFTIFIPVRYKQANKQSWRNSYYFWKPANFVHNNIILDYFQMEYST